MSPFFSIIIPTYNVAHLLPSALDSIISQEYKKLEVIIMDGQSRDDTIKIAKEYAMNDSRIQVFSELDRGIYDAMNKGIKLTSGDYLFFLGSDDTFYDTSVLKVVAETLINNPVDIIYGNVYSTRFGGVYDGVFNWKKLFYKNICHQSIFFKKSVFDKIGDFNLQFKAHADYDHNIKWFFSSKITHRFENIIIANYADGGFSSIQGDPQFKKNKKDLFLERGFGKIPVGFYLKHKYPLVMSKLLKLKRLF